MGPRLKLARKAAGLSLRALSDKIGNKVSAQAIGKYERNESMPSSGVLIDISGALDVSVDYLLRSSGIQLGDVDFRRKKKEDKKIESQIKANVVNLVERYLEVEELLDLSSKDWEAPKGTPYKIDDLDNGPELAAQFVREAWGLGIDPLPNLVELLEDRGVKVLSMNDSHIDGLTAEVSLECGGGVPVIVVNEDDWSERKRFSIAHEVGHLLMREPASFSSSQIESAANRFAGAFLMPAESLILDVGKSRSSISLGELIELKKIYGVSVQAIAFRCRDLGIISKSLMGKLFGLFTVKGYRKWPYEEPESMKPEIEMPKRFERLCYRALSEGVASEARVAEFLGIPVRDLRDRVTGKNV
jgi:Zn-dependent peptidase ImmA (M78 family)/DNA-binding XRE family transcriptional regulator